MMRTGTVTIATCVVFAACGGPPPYGGSTAAPPPSVTAVGPIPGPQTASSMPANPYANDRTAMGEGRQLFVRFNLTGIAGNICVLFTANDAYMRDLRIFAPADCIVSNTAGDNDHALRQIEKVLKGNATVSTRLSFRKGTGARKSVR